MIEKNRTNQPQAVGIVFIIGLFVIGVLLVAWPASGRAQAQGEVNLGADILKQLEAGGAAAELGTPQDPRLIVASVIRILLSTMGTVFFCLTVYAGYLWLTSHGEQDRADKAKKILNRSVWGLIIVLISYSITLFVTGALQDIIRSQ